MKRIFLGKPGHWLLLIALVAVGWVTGQARLHVIWFNLYLLGILVLTGITIALVLKTSKPQEQITRDPLPTDDELAG